MRNLHIGNLFALPRNSWSCGFLLKWLDFDYDNSPNNHKCEHSFTLLIALTWFQSTWMEKSFYMLIFSIFLMPSHTNIHKLYWYPTGLLLIKLATSCCHMISLNPQHMRGILWPRGWSVWGVCLQTCICPCVYVWPRPFIWSDTLWNARFSMPISITSTLPLIRQCRRCP